MLLLMRLKLSQMKMPVLEWLWPRLQKQTEIEAVASITELKETHDDIKSSDWGSFSDVALEEARRLFDAEQDRRRGSDTKAGIYLAAITALVPVLASVLPSLWKDDMNKFYAAISIIFFCSALIYLFRAGLWAFRTLSISTFALLGPAELVKAARDKKSGDYLVRQLLHAVTVNFSGTNQKVSSIKMTHAYLIRSFVCFVVFLTFQSLWPVGVWVFSGVEAKFWPQVKLYCV